MPTVLPAAAFSAAPAPLAGRKAAATPPAAPPDARWRQLGRSSLWAGAGVVVGAAPLALGRALAPQWTAAAAAGVGLGCSTLIPAALGATLLHRYVAHALQHLAAGDAGTNGLAQQLSGELQRWLPKLPLPAPATQAAYTGALIGVSCAPLLLGGLAASGTLVAMTCVIGAASALWRQATWAHAPTPALALADMATVAGQLAVAHLPWSLAAGLHLGAALATSAVALPLALTAMATARYWLRNSGQGRLTAYCDGHQVQPAQVARYRADCLGEPKPTVHNVPAAVVAKLAAAQQNLLLDGNKAPYWLGLPMLTLDGAPGTGKTSLACAIAQKLNADLLSTSASQLKRVYLPGIPVGLIRLMTMVAQAELRSLRTGRLQVLFVDEMGSLFPRRIDVQSAAGLRQLAAMAATMFTLMFQSSRRNGVFLVLADNHVEASKNALMCVSANPPAQVVHPDAAALQTIFANKIKALQDDLARKWRTSLFDGFTEQQDFAQLKQLVGQLARVDATGRDVTGIVARMRRAAEAQLGGRTPHQPHEVQGAAVAEGLRAGLAYATTLRPQPRLPAAAAPAHDLDADTLNGLAGKLAQKFLGAPLSLLRDASTQQLSLALNPRQALDMARINAAYAGSVQAIVDRLGGADADTYAQVMAQSITMQFEMRAEDDPLVDAYLKQRFPRAHAALRRTLLPRPAPKMFLDATVPNYGYYVLVGLQKTQAKLQARSEDHPYARFNPFAGQWVMLRQRIDGRRIDPLRSEYSAEDLLAKGLREYRRHEQTQGLWHFANQDATARRTDP